MSVSIVVAGGHSAGHIEPALSVADALRRLEPDTVITALGTVRGLDTRLIPGRGYPLELIPPVPLPRQINSELLSVPGRLWTAVRAAEKVLAEVQADVVVGFGGYVALPAYLAARKQKVGIVVHEANARPGITNRVGARLTANVLTASAGVGLAHGEPVGIPLRPEIALLDRTLVRHRACTEFGLNPDLPVLLVTGGSQGAESINRVIARCRPLLRSAGIQVLHIVGPGRGAGGSLTGMSDPDSGDTGAAYRQLPFVEHMELAYAAADFVLCRSGAMTCAELSAVGLPALYVPLPLRGGEQRLNAEAIVRAGGGLLVSDEQLSVEWISRTLLPCLLDPARRAGMSAAALRMARPDADVVIARHVLAVARNRRRVPDVKLDS